MWERPGRGLGWAGGQRQFWGATKVSAAALQPKPDAARECGALWDVAGSGEGRRLQRRLRARGAAAAAAVCRKFL